MQNTPDPKRSPIVRIRRSLRTVNLTILASEIALTSPSWNRRALQAALNDVPGYFSCHSASCDYGHIHDDQGANDNIWRCQNPACNALICTLHEVPFHTGETCAQYDERLATAKRSRTEDTASEDMVARSSKPCPGPDCGRRIEKNGGCDHMTCELCWPGVLHVPLY